MEKIHTIADIAKRLLPMLPKSGHVLITGPSGIGKTYLASLIHGIAEGAKPLIIQEGETLDGVKMTYCRSMHRYLTDPSKLVIFTTTSTCGEEDSDMVIDLESADGRRLFPEGPVNVSVCGNVGVFDLTPSEASE